MKKYIIDEKLAGNIQQYLASRPLRETVEMWAGLTHMQEYVEAPAPESKPKLAIVETPPAPAES